MLAARITSVLVNRGKAYGTSRGRPGAIMRRLVHATHRWCFQKKIRRIADSLFSIAPQVVPLPTSTY